MTLLLRSPRFSATKQRAPSAGHLEDSGVAPLGSIVDPVQLLQSLRLRADLFSSSEDVSLVPKSHLDHRMAAYQSSQTIQALQIQIAVECCVATRFNAMVPAEVGTACISC